MNHLETMRAIRDGNPPWAGDRRDPALAAIIDRIIEGDTVTNEEIDRDRVRRMMSMARALAEHVESGVECKNKNCPHSMDEVHKIVDKAVAVQNGMRA